MPTTERLWLKVLFSVWICYHLIVLIVMPNGASYLGRSLGFALKPYAAVIGLNTSWNFFSPDPAHTMYLKFTIHFEDKDGNPSRDPEELFFPASKDEGVGNIASRRELYAMRYMLLDPRRIDVIIGPWLCRTHPNAIAVHIEFVVNSIPSLDEAVLFRDQAVSEMGQKYDYIDKDYRCSEAANEVTL